MTDELCFLVTIFDIQSEVLIKCALKVKSSQITEDCWDFPLEEENRKLLRSLLPSHVRECGPIVDVEHLFEVHVQ